MSNSRTKNIRLGCEIALSVLSGVLAVLFITFIAQIYYSSDGEGMYSRAVVWSKLKYMIAPIVIWGVVAIGCFVLSVIFPDQKRPAKLPSAGKRLERLRKKIPGQVDGKYINAEHKQYVTLETWRYIAYGVASLFALGVAMYAVVYLSHKSKFSSGNINDDILLLVKNVFPWMIASFGLFVGALIYEHVVAKPQLDRVPKILVASKGLSLSSSMLATCMDNAKAYCAKKEDKIVLGMRIAVAAIAVMFIGIGIWDGGMGDVLGKAVAICTECIGLG